VCWIFLVTFALPPPGSFIPTTENLAPKVVVLDTAMEKEEWVATKINSIVTRIGILLDKPAEPV
jgi:hypothetical protein